MRASNRPHAQDGFTVIEILTGILIMGILMGVLMFTLTGSLKLNRQSQQQLSTASRAQEILENIRGAWQTPDHLNYDRICAPVNLPEGYSARVINLDSRANPLDAGTDVRVNSGGTTINCASQSINTNLDGQVPVMRRVIVKTGTGPQDTTLTLDVLR